MIYIGCHLSTADGYAAMGKAITAMGGNTFACIGLEALMRIALHRTPQGLPFILETPNDDEGYIEEIKMVKGWFCCDGNTIIS